MDINGFWGRSERQLRQRMRYRAELERQYDTKVNRRLKYTAIALCGVAVALMASTVIWIDEIPFKTMMLMRGCTGLCGMGIFIIGGIIAYRSYTALIKKKYHTPRDKEDFEK